jgi:hypothetical protein
MAAVTKGVERGPRNRWLAKERNLDGVVVPALFTRTRAGSPCFARGSHFSLLLAVTGVGPEAKLEGLPHRETPRDTVAQ